jgi:hypothetical protein
MMKKILSILFGLTAVILIDQIFYFYNLHKNNHYLFCKFKDCSKGPFTKNKKHNFLLNPKNSFKLQDLAQSKSIPKHNDYLLNKHGFRLSNDSSKKTNINLFGDSFTFGLYLGEEQQIATLLNKMSKKCHFKNYGVPAYDLLQMVNLSLDKDLVQEAQQNLFLFISDDLIRITRQIEVHPYALHTTIWDLQKDLNLRDGIVPTFRIPTKLIKSSFFFYKLYTIFEKKFWAQTPYQTLLDKFKKRSEQSGIPAIFIHLPSPSDYKLVNRAEEVFRPSTSFKDITIKKFENILNKAPYFFKNDGHPTPLGARTYANGIAKRLKSTCF